nr:acyltransferase [Chitinophagaceae bacterium]
MRIVGLDILRSIAILLVLIRHSELENTYVHKFGWLGVDLFFVISGFLVSGLLFSEYKKTQQVNIRRFLIRRGLKIYPSFYFFLIVNILINYFFQDIIPTIPRLLSELFYVQNYLPYIFTHTWSLAVEEHFYIILAITLFILWKYSLFSPKPRYIIYLGILLLTVYVLRMVLYTAHAPNFSLQHTHLRADGIIIGVLLAYLFYFTDYCIQLLKYKWILLPIALVLLIPGFIWHGGDALMITVGLALVNIGFGILVLLIIGSHQIRERKPSWRKALGFIGVHSYSIYLWHLTGYYFLLKVFHYNTYIMTGLYIISSLLVGIFFSLTIEKTFLKMREYSWVKKWY